MNILASKRWLKYDQMFVYLIRSEHPNAYLIETEFEWRVAALEDCLTSFVGRCVWRSCRVEVGGAAPP